MSVSFIYQFAWWVLEGILQGTFRHYHADLPICKCAWWILTVRQPYQAVSQWCSYLSICGILTVRLTKKHLRGFLVCQSA
jgi:hypothetical protein